MRIRQLISIIALGACASNPPAVPSPPTIIAQDSAALVQLMQNEDTRIYDAATFARLYGSPSSLIRSRTVLAAGRISDRTSIPLLVRALTDSSLIVRQNAAFALGEIGDSTATDAIAALGRDGSPEAIHALGKIGGAQARGLVEQVLQSNRNPAATREALLAIWKFPRLRSTTTLVSPFLTSRDTALVWRAMYALIRPLPDPANLEIFRKFATHADPLVRSFAVRGFRAANMDSVPNGRTIGAAALLAALKDGDAHVRINAVSVLGGYRNAEHGSAVASLLANADFNVRIVAAQALGLIRGTAAADALFAHASDRSEQPSIRGTELGSLLAADPARGLDLARTFLSDANPVLHVYVARALGALKTAPAFELARQLAASPDPRVAGAALGSASAIAADTLQAARALFIESLAATDATVRAAAISGLGKLARSGDEAMLFDALERALRDDIEDAGIAAIDELARLARQNPAIQRTFATRFPLSRIPNAQVQREAIQEMHVEGTCCQVTADVEKYRRVVGTLLLPALRGAAMPRIRITTERAGPVDVEMLASDAPLTVDNFMSLARRGYFNGSRWHRVVPNFVLQDGDPTGTGSGGPGYAIRDEMNRVRYDRGAMGMALSGPDTGGSQFFITHSPQPHLDGGYTVFGRVVAGMENADKIIQDDRITSIEILK